MAKAKAAPKHPKAKDKAKKNVRRVPIRKMPADLMPRDRIVESLDKDGYVKTSTEVQHVVIAEGCQNVHVNKGMCYDKSVHLYVAVPEEEALAMGAKK